MHALSELYEGSDDLQMDVMPGKGDLPQMEAEEFDDWEDSYDYPTIRRRLQGIRGPGQSQQAISENTQCWRGGRGWWFSDALREDRV
uniref:Uncharacterized protein n=1 Tax=Myotis myotis TaxID=51298 RepID=A0A7J7XFA6_MYOMY|nr:hypothetical protein mMyoMyo1_004351 [Myotis myotis]